MFIEFDIRRISQYVDVDVRSQSGVLELGMLDDGERRRVASVLREAADDLLHGLSEVAP